MLDKKCLNYNSIDFTRSYEEIRAYLFEIYGEIIKLKSKSTATSPRENVLKFSNCFQNLKEKASTFAQNLKVLVENAFITMNEKEKDERSKEQFVEGLYDVGVKRETFNFLTSSNIKANSIGERTISYNEMVQYAIACEKAQLIFSSRDINDINSSN